MAEIAALPAQEEKRGLWRKLNGLKPERPMVMIDQICWEQMNIGDELTLQCKGRECRGYENRLRMILYRSRHFPVDEVVEPFIGVGKAVNGVNRVFGIRPLETTARTEGCSVVGHLYENQFKTGADLEKIKMPQISHDEAETERRLAVAHELFDGIIEVRPAGVNPYLSLWDPISWMMTVEGPLYAIVDQPGLVHGILSRMTDGYLSMLDQLEGQGLLCEPQ